MADKPVCPRCSVGHWRFVKCEDAAAANAKDDTAAAVRAKQVVPIQWRFQKDRAVRLGTGRDPNKVYPEWNNDGPRAA